MSLSLKSQTCDGNLGENIFNSGNFGNGASNLSPNFRNIAPGYTFTSNPPPVDGFFTITNSTAIWSGLYPTWLAIGDASVAPDGYMMVVNASFDPGLFYEQEIDGLCENTLYEFSADIINLIRQNVTGHILPNVSFLIDGQIVLETGGIPQNEKWITYNKLFTTDPGQTTVKLALRNNAPGGIGNDLALDNISFRACGPQALILPQEIDNICESGNPIRLEATIIGDQYNDPQIQWQRSADEGRTWENISGENATTFNHTDLRGGFYYYRYLLANGTANLQNSKCRVISNVKIVYVQPKFWNVIDTICEGNEFMFGDKEINQSGIYTDSLISSIGCDSIVTLDLTTMPNRGISANILAVSPLCPENYDGEISIENIDNGYPPYMLTVNDEPDNNNSIFQNLPPGIYDISISDRFGCNFFQTVELFSPNGIELDIGSDIKLILGDPAEIVSKTNLPVTQYIWQPGSEINCPNCPSIQFFPTQNMLVKLDVITEKGCIATDSLYIEVISERRLFIPSAFSPNNDGINDYFNIYGQVPNIKEVKKLQIFDRWGNMLFSETNFMPNEETKGWNGEFRGKQLDTGIYTYLVEILFLDGKSEIFSGDLTLIR